MLAAVLFQLYKLYYISRSRCAVGAEAAPGIGLLIISLTLTRLFR
jgi:hypothetical protein